MTDTMPRRKKGSPEPEPLERESFLFPRPLLEALAAFIASQPYPPTKSAVVRQGLEKLLAAEGFWPPPAKPEAKSRKS